ncbi:unnamed protein product, partial [Rangifer tarandus platyrhynchus]
AYRFIQDCLAVPRSMSYSSTKQPAVVAEGNPIRSLLPQQMQRSQPRRDFSGLACPASSAAKGCLP